MFLMFSISSETGRVMRLVFIGFPYHAFNGEKVFVLWVTSTPQAGIEGNVVVADLEVFACCLKVDLPPDAIDDQPVADLLVSFVDHLEREPLKVFPDSGVGFMPLPKVLFAFLESCHNCRQLVKN